MQRNQKTKQPWKRKIKCVITLLDFESCQDCMALAEGQTHRPKGWSLEAGAHKYSQQTEDRGVAPEQLKIHTQKEGKQPQPKPYSLHKINSKCILIYM